MAIDIDIRLNEVMRRLTDKENALRARFEAEEREKQEIADLQREGKELQHQKAERDFANDLITQDELNSQNQQARERLVSSDLNQLLNDIRVWRSRLQDDISPTYAAAIHHAEHVIGEQTRFLAADYAYDHQQTSSQEIKTVLGPEIYERAQKLKSPWNLRSCLASWTRDAADDDDYRARAAICFLLLGEILNSEGVTDAQIQQALDNMLHDHLSGAR